MLASGAMGGQCSLLIIYYTQPSHNTSQNNAAVLVPSGEIEREHERESQKERRKEVHRHAMIADSKTLGSTLAHFLPLLYPRSTQITPMTSTLPSLVSHQPRGPSRL